MGPIVIALLLLALVFGGLGFALHVLWWIALILLVAWFVAFILGRRTY